MTTADTTAPANAPAVDFPDDGWTWVVVEVFGHQKHAGRMRAEEHFGTKFMRVDVPNKGDPDTHGWTTVHLGGNAIFRWTLATEEACLKINRPYEPPARLALPAFSDGAEDDELF